VSCKRYF